MILALVNAAAPLVTCALQIIQPVSETIIKEVDNTSDIQGYVGYLWH